MFNPDFYPTPEAVIERMTAGIDFHNTHILEPSAGSGNIVEYVRSRGAGVIACEIEPKLRAMLHCRVIAEDFLTLKSEQVSHIQHIVMNPPFSADAQHILHAWEIAPAGCEVRALCNWETIANPYTRSRKILKQLTEEYGSVDYLGNCFTQAERKTNVEVAFVHLRKPGAQQDEWEGFFMEEEEENLIEGLQRYNFVRDVVSRYIGAVRIFDEQLDAAIRMNALTSSFYNSKIALNMTEGDAKMNREAYKKDLQKAAWNYVLNKMQMDKYVTTGVRNDINKFVETQQQIPFTMKNIYAMIQIIVGTQKSRMERALEEVFDNITKHYHENRYNVEGWKTNSHYLVNQRFILDGLTELGYHGEVRVRYNSYRLDIIEDLQKALCYVTGKDYSKCISLYNRCQHSYLVERDGKIVCDPSVSHQAYPLSFRDEEALNRYLADHPGCKRSPKPEWGKWFYWEFFQIRCYKKGTIHFQFKDEQVWGRFNQEVARIKGYPLYEPNTKGGKSCQR